MEAESDRFDRIDPCTKKKKKKKGNPPPRRLLLLLLLPLRTLDYITLRETKNFLLCVQKPLDSAKGGGGAGRVVFSLKVP